MLSVCNNICIEQGHYSAVQPGKIHRQEFGLLCFLMKEQHVVYGFTVCNQTTGKFVWSGGNLLWSMPVAPGGTAQPTINNLLTTPNSQYATTAGTLIYNARIS